MNRTLLLTLLVMGQYFLMGCQIDLPQTAVPVPQATAVAESAPTAVPATVPSAEKTTISCAQPSEGLLARCEAMTQQVLASTVRLQVRRWQRGADGWKEDYLDGGVGHATVKDGRYLVTHNHYGVPLAYVAPDQMVQLSVFTWNGEVVVKDMPVTAFSVAVVDAETLVLDLGQYGETGLLDMLGLASAQYQSVDSLALQPGMEVAQVDWNGDVAHVDWVQVEEVVLDEGVPRLVLANGLAKGASGGGVYWQGVHVANNLSCASTYNQLTGELLGQSSVAAVNSSQSLSQTSLQAAN